MVGIYHRVDAGEGGEVEGAGFGAELWAHGVDVGEACPEAVGTAVFPHFMLSYLRRTLEDVGVSVGTAQLGKTSVDLVPNLG